MSFLAYVRIGSETQVTSTVRTGAQMAISQVGRDSVLQTYIYSNRRSTISLYRFHQLLYKSSQPGKQYSGNETPSTEVLTRISLVCKMRRFSRRILCVCRPSRSLNQHVALTVYCAPVFHSELVQRPKRDRFCQGRWERGFSPRCSRALSDTNVMLLPLGCRKR
jgi:hypothetical protein